jgi:16S rRNA (uracil1498-N3)-methyltransferase
LSLFYQPDIEPHYLSEEESRHAIKVLRLQRGDAIRITDGKGNFYDARITETGKHHCHFEILKTEKHPARDFQIHIAIAPTKNADRIEWFVEKAVEIGVEKISFLLCQNSERKSINLERIEKIAVGAMKQSQQAWLPQLTEMKKFDEVAHELADQKFIAVVDATNPIHLKQLATPAQKYLVLIGPEGDFRMDEIETALQNGFNKVSLGANRLRTETAGLAACHILNLIQ